MKSINRKGQTGRIGGNIKEKELQEEKEKEKKKTRSRKDKEEARTNLSRRPWRLIGLDEAFQTNRSSARQRVTSNVKEGRAFSEG
jgi:hypothetical protein